MFGDYWSMDLTGVGENDVTVDQLREDELMNGSGGRMDPAQFSCGFELLRTKRPGNHDFSILKMIFDTVVAAKVHHFQLSEILAQALWKPFGSVPEIEAMMKEDEKFHRTFEAQRTLRYTK